ncbi:MAG: beta-lactamase family protein [Marinisporobacter sp.]|jgi:CubicO group peptidase (beta-lactamase class C family)|nr:beta-lactamase family protein [Marinisporobacter sp.]
MNAIKRQLPNIIVLLCIVAMSIFHFGMSKEKKMDFLFREFDRASEGPGASVMVIKDGEILVKKGYGLADLKRKIPADEYTNYRIASMTKQFTAMCVMILKERGLLTYDTKLTDIFPDFPDYGKDITIKDLLQHTSGLVDFYDFIPENQKEQLKDEDVFNMYKAENRLKYKPGTKYEYVDGNYVILSNVIEKISGMRFAEFLQKNIFKPLEMNNTVAYEKGIATVKNRAYGMSKRDGKFIETDQNLTSATLGDGGIYTSLMDYYKWDQALYTEKLVSFETLNEAFSNGVKDSGTGDFYGFGWGYFFSGGKKILCHTGGTIGFTTVVTRIPSEKLTVVIFTNYNNLDIWRKYLKPVVKIYSNAM